jgi:hypothetical protein
LSLALLCFAGSAIAYALRSNLSFAIVCMVKEDPNATVEAKAGCSIEEESGSSSNAPLFNSTFPTTNANASTVNPGDQALLVPPPPLGEFEWSKAMQGQVLGSVYIKLTRRFKSATKFYWPQILSESQNVKCKVNRGCSRLKDKRRKQKG